MWLCDDFLCTRLMTGRTEIQQLVVLAAMLALEQVDVQRIVGGLLRIDLWFMMGRIHQDARSSDESFNPLSMATTLAVIHSGFHNSIFV